MSLKQTWNSSSPGPQESGKSVILNECWDKVYAVSCITVSRFGPSDTKASVCQAGGMLHSQRHIVLTFVSLIYVIK